VEAAQTAASGRPEVLPRALGGALRVRFSRLLSAFLTGFRPGPIAGTPPPCQPGRGGVNRNSSAGAILPAEPCLDTLGRKSRPAAAQGPGQSVREGNLVRKAGQEWLAVEAWEGWSGRRAERKAWEGRLEREGFWEKGVRKRRGRHLKENEATRHPQSGGGGVACPAAPSRPYPIKGGSKLCGITLAGWRFVWARHGRREGRVCASACNGNAFPDSSLPIVVIFN